MDEGPNNSLCKVCDDIVDGQQLIAEVEHLRRHLSERDTHIATLEAKYQNSAALVNNLDEQLATWEEKYERIYDSHKRVQKLNQVLEDKLLQMVDKMKSEKSQLTKDIATLSVRLAESKHNYSMLQKENERYKNDMNLAIQLLQCKPDNFVSHKLDNLPVDTQARVSQYVMSKTAKPPSSQLKVTGDNETFDASEYEFNISASLMSKILEDSIQDTVTKHCDTCTCAKSQAKPFCYNESYYSIATQTHATGDIKSYVCANCHIDMTSLHSNLSIRSLSPPSITPVNKDFTQKLPHLGHTYIIPQPNRSDLNLPNIEMEGNKVSNTVNYANINAEIKKDLAIIKNETVKANKHLNGTVMEPAIHHKLCDHPRASISSKKSSTHSIVQEEPLLRDAAKVLDKTKNENNISDSVSLRKNSLSSMGAVSRTSSVAKSTVSTHKSNGNVGPGPRFCHLRMQPGSKNILLDNVEPDVPPVIYKRQSKCNENTIFKDLIDGMEDFVDLEKQTAQDNVKNENVVESTLIDVDNNNKETTVDDKSINPVLLNVSSSPLQPLKTHNFSQNAEPNNNTSKNNDTLQNNGEIDNLLNDFAVDINNGNPLNDGDIIIETVTTPDNEIKIFNFDRYEQNKMSSQYSRPMKKIDMSQLHSLENTKISKDLAPQEFTVADKKVDPVIAKPNLPSIVNVYPNLTQTKLQVNETKNIFTNEQSSSSLSSDDSAALLQKQQLLRVAEWVEKNLEQQNNFNDPLEDEVPYNRSLRRNSKLSRATETISELVLNMPHPVSKYSKSYSREVNNAWIHNTLTSPVETDDKPKIQIAKANIVKETIFPVEYGEAVTEVSSETQSNTRAEAKESEVNVEKRESVPSTNGKDITPEELARMEYNVKKFLLSGPYWVSPGTHGKSRRTISKTETDV